MSSDAFDTRPTDSPGSLGERLAARGGALAHSAAAFEGLAAELDDGAPASSGLSATKLFKWLARDGGDGLARRIERALPRGRLVVLALPNAPAAGLELRAGDLLVRVARGQGPSSSTCT